MAIVCCLSGYAQQDAYKQAIAIKKNSDYIYGEASGDDEEACYEMAREKLLTKVQNFVSNQPELSSADGFVVDNIKSKTKKLTYERSIQIKVVCVYVHKKDILPLYKSKNQEKEEAPVIVEDKTEQPKVEEQKIVLVPKQEVEVPKARQVKDKIQQEELVSVIEDITLVEAEKEVTVERVVPELTYTSRVNEILGTVLKMTNYEDIYNYLDNEKNTRYDIRFKLVKQEFVEDCFWLIFNPSRELIAAFDKKRVTNLMDAEGKGWESYKNYPKMWIHIYE